MTATDLVKPPPVLMFIHLPKCAGTTLIKSFARLGFARHLIISRASGSKTQAVEDLKAAMVERDVDPQALGAVSGHDVFMGLHEVTGRQARYATILRDPVARYISHYRFFVDCALNEDHIIHEYTKGIVIENGRPISLDSFAEREIVTNTMATYLAAANHPDRQSKRASLQDPEQILDLASACLRRLDFIGLVEKFPADLARLCTVAGIPPAPAANKSSFPPPAADMSEQLIQKILDNNKLDLYIYRLAQELRRGKLKSMGFDIDDDNATGRTAGQGTA